MENEEKLTRLLAQGRSIEAMLDELPVEELRRLANLPDRSGFEAPTHRMISSLSPAGEGETLRCAACPREFTLSDEDRRMCAIGRAPLHRFCRDCRFSMRNAKRAK